MTVTSIRLAHLLTAGFLLNAGTVLFALGFFELTMFFAFLSTAASFLGFLPASTRALARAQFAECKLAKAQFKGLAIDEARYTRARSALYRSRVRRALDVPRVRLDVTFAFLNVISWCAFAVFLAGAALAL